MIEYGDQQLTLKSDPDTNEPTAYGSTMKKLFLPEYIYGLSVERIADYVVVKVSVFLKSFFFKIRETDKR